MFITVPVIPEYFLEGVTPENYKEFKNDGLANESRPVLAALDHNLGDGEGLKNGATSKIIPVSVSKDGGITKTSLASVVSEKGLAQVLKRTRENLVRIGEEILSGENAASPFEYSQKAGDNACRYCAFRPVCGFDTKLPGYHTRKLAKLDKDEVLRRIAEAEGGESHE